LLLSKIISRPICLARPSSNIKVSFNPDSARLMITTSSAYAIICTEFVDKILLLTGTSFDETHIPKPG
jgi:hypothetical protein